MMSRERRMEGMEPVLSILEELKGTSINCPFVAGKETGLANCSNEGGVCAWRLNGNSW